MKKEAIDNTNNNDQLFDNVLNELKQISQKEKK
jgi:hypothetical protein